MKKINETSNDLNEVNAPMGSLEKFRRMATVIQDSYDAITFQDLEGNILAWNRGAELMYGYSEADALRMNIVDTVPKEYQEEARAFLTSLKRGELVPTLETKRKTKNGKIVDVWLTNTKLTDDKGKLTGIATTERDISQRKRSETEFKEKARELEFLRDGQITLSNKMRGEQDISRLGQSVLSHLAPFLNAQMGAFYYLTEEKMLKRVSGYAYTKIDSKTKVICLGEGLVGQAALEKGTILIENLPSTYFGTIGSDLGESTPHSLLLAPIFYEGEVNGVIELASFNSFTEHQKTFLSHVSENIGIAINTSISLRKQQQLLERSQNLTEALQAQKSELKSSNYALEVQSCALQKSQTLLEERSNEVQRASQYKSDFLANMSHEIRTPLGAILGFLNLLKDSVYTEEEKNTYMVIVERNSKQLLSLIDDILDLSKVESGKMTIETIQFSLVDMLTDFSSLMTLKSAEKGIHFQVITETLIPDLIYSDPVRLRQVLGNMVGNAIKFTESGSVQMSISYANPVLAFTITDTGIGISKDQSIKLFKPFTQANSSTTRNFGGTGLGLVLSRRFTESLGGKLELVKSEDGIGSTFLVEIKSILLPQAKLVGKEALTDRSQIISTDFKKHSHTLAGLKILLVEDSLDNQMLISLLLKNEGALVKSAHNGAQGVALALAGNFDVILMDIQMPILDGHEATIQLRRAKYSKPIIALTAHAMKEERTKCLASGFTEFLTKPIQNELMITLLANFFPSQNSKEFPSLGTHKSY